MEILLEAYYGKTKQLKLLEDTIDKIRAKYGKRWRDDIPHLVNQINSDSLVKDIIRILIMDQFGFRTVIMKVTGETRMQASTMQMVVTDHEVKFLKELTKQECRHALITTPLGLRFNENVIQPYIMIMMTIGLLLSEERVTTQEIVAVLLHEIGHGFNAVLMNGNDKFNDRIDENFADNFVSMYGYGSELNSVLGKIYTANQYQYSETLRKIPVVNIVLGLDNIAKSLIARKFGNEEHPTLYRRMLNNIERMEYDLKKSDLRKEQKEELKLCIDKARNDLESYYDDTPYMSDRIYKYYSKNLEHRLDKEISADKYAQQYGSYKIFDQKIKSIR